MNDRTPVLLTVIGLLVAMAVYLNWDLFQPGFDHSRQIENMLTWQGEEEARDLELRRGLDLQGGLQVLLEVDREKTGPFSAADLSQAANVIKNRVDILGVTEAQVQTQGEDKIVVELPGVEDPEMAVRTIGQTALLEFIYAGEPGALAPGEEVVTTEPTVYEDLPEDRQEPRLYSPDELAEVQGIEPTSPVTTSEEITATEGTTETFASRVYPTVVTGEHLTAASVTVDPLRPGQFVVNFSLNSEGGNLMRRFTSAHQQEVMAIVLDKEVISAPVVQAVIGSDGQITGDFTQEEADILVAQLRSGSLPVSLQIVGQTQIGPTLGRESVEQSILGGVLGMLAVMLFMLLYYRVPGFLADIALIIYALLTMSLFRVIPVTLTLAGIAGFVLSIGMAVDANILIFERMKEELRSGRSMRAAMDIGFRRAWPSIRDSNLSTLITCAILFWFGNQFGASIVKGFAITLALGVVTSLFTAITVTRTFLHLSNRFLLSGERVSEPLRSPRLRTLFGF